jgi:hypothetical protein
VFVFSHVTGHGSVDKQVLLLARAGAAGASFERLRNLGSNGAIDATFL